MFLRPLREQSLWVQVQLGVCAFTMLAAILTLFFDWGVWLLFIALTVMIPMACWQMFTGARLLRQARRYHDAVSEAQLKAIAEDRSFNFNDLPPELHENVQVAWARKRLKEK